MAPWPVTPIEAIFNFADIARLTLGTEGWAGRLAGQRLDERIRYEDLPEDKIYPAVTPREAVELLVKLLPAYTKKARLCRETAEEDKPA